MKATRNTKQREAILKIVRETCSHPTADWVYKRVRREIPDISLGTVYRNLNMLSDQGRLRRIFTHGSKKARFDANVEPHNHLICRICNSITDIPPHGFSTDIPPALKRARFKVHFIRIDIHGVCKNCR